MSMQLVHVMLGLHRLLAIDAWAISNRVSMLSSTACTPSRNSSHAMDVCPSCGASASIMLQVALMDAVAGCRVSCW